MNTPNIDKAKALFSAASHLPENVFTPNQKLLFKCLVEHELAAAEKNRELAAKDAEIAALKEVAGWAQATLTVLNVGDVGKGSLLHLKLREVMIEYRKNFSP